MIRILFVDDEPNILSGLRRQLHVQRAAWEMQFVGSGDEALATLARWPADIVVSDMRMPGMDGAELLRQVRARWPAAVRLVLSGHADRVDLLRSVHHAHQYLTKPCDPCVLRAVVERVMRLRANVAQPELLERVAQLDHLPSLPALYQEIAGGLQGERFAIHEIAALIEQDVALAAKVMQVMNSAFFGPPGQVSSPAQAAVALGPETLRSLILDAALFEPAVLDAARQHEIENLWLRSQHVAQLSRCFATDLALTRPEQDHAFLAGLLHEVGRLVVLSGDGTAADAIVHPPVGAFLLAAWGFANGVVDAVASQTQQPAAGQGGVATALQLALCAARGALPDPAVLSALHPPDAFARRQADHFARTLR